MIIKKKTIGNNVTIELIKIEEGLMIVTEGWCSGYGLTDAEMLAWFDRMTIESLNQNDY